MQAASSLVGEDANICFLQMQLPISSKKWDENSFLFLD